MSSRSDHIPSFQTTHQILSSRRISIVWRTVPSSSVDSGVTIPPSDDELRILFEFTKENEHTFGLDIEDTEVLESFCLPQSDNVITIHPSELCGEDTTSIMQSDSVCLIVDFVNTHFPPLDKENMLPIIVDKIIKLVHDSTSSFPLPSNRVIVVRRRDVATVLHYIDDDVKEMGIRRHFRITKRGTCSICMDNYEVGLNGSRLPCLHVFHGVCIVQWLVRNPSCPICRNPISAEMATWY